MSAALYVTQEGPDIVVKHHEEAFPFVCFYPVSTVGNKWLLEHARPESCVWMGEAFTVERAKAAAFREKAVSEGLVVDDSEGVPAPRWVGIR